ncbi:MAG: hypothetical protein ACXABY_21230 [Candidatus Thorarchaeota archaeon]|jgi:hypothetical protein
MAANKKIQGVYSKEKETKNKIRYRSNQNPDPLETIYIYKHSLLETFDEYPDRLTVTIESSGA